MSTVMGKGNYVAGQFIQGGDQTLTSLNPARDYEPVFEARTASAHVDQAVDSARTVLSYWASLTQEQRIEAMMRLKEAFRRREDEIAKAITLEMGKPLSESLAEAKNLSARIDLMATHGLKRVATEHPEGVMGEARYHAQGVLAVLGPYNFPAHLVNAHVIPALLTGNTVVVKPSEVCPWVGQLYAECVHEAALPPGVFNLVQGRADVGKALVKHQAIRGILFTGSYQTGRALAEAVLDEPHKMLALEMGGKNIAVVLSDADLYQALVEIVQGAFLTTGQRCTATSRVLVDRSVSQRLIDSLVRVTKNLKPGDPLESSTAFGPLATQIGLERFCAALKHATQAGAQVLHAGEVLGGGAFVTPSLHLLDQKDAPGYLDTELFGPDLCIEVIDGVDEAIARTNESAYGLSNAIFTASKPAFEQYYRETHSGVLNWNRGTNGASGQLPFGGVGKSGNQRAAGIDAVRYTTYPVAINTLPYGQSEVVSTLQSHFLPEQSGLDMPLAKLVARHELEALLERYHVPFDDARAQSVLLSLGYLMQLSFNGKMLDVAFLTEHLEPYASCEGNTLTLTLPNERELPSFFKIITQFLEKLCDQNYDHFAAIVPPDIHIPQSQRLPRSEAMLQRLYQDDFVPREKKTPVVDLYKSKGPYLSSIDEDPLVIFDAASQIASNGVGFSSGIFLRALDDGEFEHTLLSNTPNQDVANAYSELLLDHAWEGIQHATFTSSGAEANEKAFDLCRVNGPGGRRIIAFEGSFHGRTLMALQATYNPQKRGAFEFAGYEATFVPFPTWNNPGHEPVVEREWIDSWSKGKAPTHPIRDPLLLKEIESLLRVKAEIEKGDVCAVIIEPMQCEGGDKYATAQFFNGLRALTRFYKVPLIFDEVQTGFGLLGPFYYHTHFQLKNAKGDPDGPDCITLAKKAQVGVCLSTWPDTRPGDLHVVQAQRGMLQAQAILQGSPERLEQEVESRLAALQHRFPTLVENTRQKGYAFAFDLPNSHIANQFINQRFYRGFMVYIAGEKTVRFRLNLTSTTIELDTLFGNISAILAHIEEQGDNSRPEQESFHNYVSPAWIPPKAESKRVDSPTTSGDLSNVTIETLGIIEWRRYEKQIEALEHAAYEPSRRDTMADMLDWIDQDGGLGLVLTVEDEGDRRVMGYAVGGPLEHSDVDGPAQDNMRGQGNTFYSANVVVHQNAQGLGLGLKLKKAQVEQVRAMKKADGQPRYQYMSGRNRVGFTQKIRRINRALGAYTVHVYNRQYGETDGKALYYRIPLRRPHVEWRQSEDSNAQKINWSSPIQAPLGVSPKEIKRDVENGAFTTAVSTKLTLSNWATPDIVRYAELLKRLAPRSCRHMYFTSGRDEVVDKGIRCLRVGRPKGDIVIGLERQYLGHTTAAARSLSDDQGQQKPFGWFEWPKVQHPNEVGTAKSIEQIRAIIDQYSAERVLGIVLELIGEKSGYVLDDSFLNAIGDLRRDTQIPLVFSETASALGRSGKALFMSDALTTKPNMVWWYTGGQLGHVLVDDAHYVSKPLTLISTWDGDEISMRRAYRHLLVAQDALEHQTAQRFEVAMRSMNLSASIKGQGLWQVLDLKDDAKAGEVMARSESMGLMLGQGFAGSIQVCPPVNVSDEEMQKGLHILKRILVEI